MIRRWLFGRRSAEPETAGWWRQAEAIATGTDVIDVTALRASLIGDAPDERERQEEMLEGLEALVSLRGEGMLPTVPTQHRVVGSEACHAIVPVTTTGSAAGPATLFLTSARVVLMRGQTQSWAWHRVRLVRTGRDLAIVASGTEAPEVVQCNSYGDALCAVHMSDQLRRSRTISA
jgi:hypothetical protein